MNSLKKCSYTAAFSGLLGLTLLSSPLRADDVSGRVGINGIAQAGWPLSQQSVKDQARNVGPDFGGMLSYGVLKNLDAGVSYENVDLGHGLRVEPILANVLYRVMPESKWTPTLLAGVGSGRGVDSNSFDHISAKGGLGLQYFVCPDFSVGPQVNFLYVAQRNQARRHVDELTAGLFASFFFGGRHEETKAAAVPAPAPVPVAAPAVAAPAVVAVALNPSTANLGGAQTQQFDATVSNASNTGVNWSINPSLGSVSATGLYTAPTTVALPETVNITATSQADATKSATSLVHLTPPAQAAKQVNITLNVLFDTGKDVVKPDYNAEIQKVADFMKSYPSARAEIEGHTDSTGPADYNTELSQKRADSVRSYLISKFAIDASRLTAKGYGPSRPIADNKTKAGRAQNRRVVATLSAMSQS